MRYGPSSQASNDRHAYIPQEAERAMTQSIEQSMPAHLKRYMNNESGYIPKSMEKAIAQEMQKSLPSHLKQYAGAYMQQRVSDPNVYRQHNLVQSSRPSNPPPVPPQLRRDHSMPFGQQHTVELDTLPLAAKSMFSSDPNSNAAQQQEPQPQTVYAPQNTPPSGPNYEFIMSPTAPKNKSFSAPSLPGMNPMLTKVVLGILALIVIIILFSVIKGVLGGASNFPALTAVAQDQQELIHIATNATQIQDLSDSNKTFAATAQLSLGSSSNQLIKYMAINGHKIGQKQLDLKISAATDQNLTGAEAAGTYNQTYDQVSAAYLNTYMNDLSTAYNLTSGHKGRTLLNSDYLQAKLLAGQLSSQTGS